VLLLLLLIIKRIYIHVFCASFVYYLRGYNTFQCMDTFLSCLKCVVCWWRFYFDCHWWKKDGDMEKIISKRLWRPRTDSPGRLNDYSWFKRLKTQSIVFMGDFCFFGISNQFQMFDSYLNMYVLWNKTGHMQP